MRFEPALIPITPNDHSVEVVYQVPTKKAVTENISVIVDTPYNVIDVRYLGCVYDHMCIEFSGTSFVYLYNSGPH